MIRMSASRYAARHQCPRLEHYRYVRGYRAAERSRALRIGDAFHVALEALWKGWKAGRHPAWAFAVDLLRRRAPDFGLDDFDVAAIEALLVGYAERWADQDLEVLAVEEWFEYPLREPDSGLIALDAVVVGKIDAIVRDARGDVYVVEHKTTSTDVSPGSDYWAKLRMDPQVSIYFDGAAALEVAGCIYDVVKKPTLRPLVATPVAKRKFTKGKPCKPCDGEPDKNETCEVCEGTGWREAPRLNAAQREFDESSDEYHDRLIADIAGAPDKYYKRSIVRRLEGEILEARRDLWATAVAIRASQGRHAPRNPSACHRYGATCAFFEVCSGSADLEGNPRLTTRRNR